MDENRKLSNQLSTFSDIVYELEIIGINIDDEDKYLRLIWSHPSSYEHIKPILIYETTNLSFKKVVSKITFEERRLKNEDNTSLNIVLVFRGRSYVKK